VLPEVVIELVPVDEVEFVVEVVPVLFVVPVDPVDPEFVLPVVL